MSQTTPMLRQYRQIKSEHPGCILFFRLGDFYEMFEDDAELAADVLQITLTSREAGQGRRIPMCGVPHHAAENYIAELVRHGHKVAICEQVEDPKVAKGVVRREVVRVVTPGAVLESSLLSEKENNFLVALARQTRPQHPAVTYGLACCDLSTGEFMCTQIEGAASLGALKDELNRLRPAEIVLDPGFDEVGALLELEAVNGAGARLVEVHPHLFHSHATARRTLLDHFGVESLEGFGCEHWPAAVRAAGAVVDYLDQTQKSQLAAITRLSVYSVGSTMLLDPATRRNLELVRTIRSHERKGSLLWLLDETLTPMGGRLLGRWVEAPLVDPAAIRERLESVRALVDAGDVRFDARQLLKAVKDIERLAGRIAHGSANARDLNALRDSLKRLPDLRETLGRAARSSRLQTLLSELDPCADIAGWIEEAIVDDPPSGVGEGGLIRRGYSKEVDELASAQAEGKEWIARLEHSERQRTQIKSLKVGYNKVFGYYVEVTKANLHLVPEEYERRQTLANAERFVTPELKAREALILGAEERLVELEYRLFAEVRDRVAGQTPRLQHVARVVAEIDVYASLAEVAVQRAYVCPAIDDEPRIFIREGRHPVVEAVLDGELFVPNDALLDEEAQIALITGPNMAGKSTYLRQTALIVLMAQIGSFVPAAEAAIGVVDRIFTRVGASDDLATGQSTFMVEMNEVANILNHATSKSLVILDEVGRGTSTFDGLSIAWALIERLHDTEGMQPKTMFATHYHELTALEQLLPRVRNFSVAVQRRGQGVHFLRRIVRGGTDQSYGIEVARLAGLPQTLIDRANEILRHLEQSGRQLMPEEAAAALEAGVRDGSTEETARQLPLLVEPDPIVAAIEAVDVNGMTPLEALNFLADLARQAKERRR